MKNLGIFSLLWMGFLIPANAQITITNAVFPAAGDILHYAVDNQPVEIIMTPPGGSQQWDFTRLRPTVTWKQVFENASAGTVHSSFPSADLLYRTGAANVETYLKVSARDVSILGYSGGSPFSLGLDLTPKFNPPIVQSRAPVQFFDINQVSSGLLLPFSASLLPAAGPPFLPAAPDSLRIRIAINRLDVVDAWGVLSIPGGAYNVLREKRTEYRETRLDGKFRVLGWLDITDLAIQYLQLDLGVDTTTTFLFLNDQSKETIAACTTDNSGLRVVSVQYKNLDTSTGIKKEESTKADLTVFPNPAGDVLHIRAGSLTGNDHTVLIYTILGQEVYRKTYPTGFGQLEETLDIAGLEKGVYVCGIINNDGQMGRALFVKR